MPTLITLTARGPLLFPKESAPTDKAVTLHGPCGLTRSGGREVGSAPTQRAGQETEDSTAGRAWSPPGEAKPLDRGSDGPSHGEVTGRLGAVVSALDLQASPLPELRESVPIREWAVWPPVFSLTARPPCPARGEGWKAG